MAEMPRVSSRPSKLGAGKRRGQRTRTTEGNRCRRLGSGDPVSFGVLLIAHCSFFSVLKLACFGTNQKLASCGVWWERANFTGDLRGLGKVIWCDSIRISGGACGVVLPVRMTMEKTRITIQILLLANCRALGSSSASSALSPSAPFWNNLTSLQTAAVVSALLLTIGAVIEYWEKIKHMSQLTMKAILGKSTPFERSVLRKIAIHSLGPILVVLGIAGEVVFEGRTFIVEDKQEQQSKQTIGQLELKASANEKEAAQLRQNAADLQKVLEPRRLPFGVAANRQDLIEAVLNLEDSSGTPVVLQSVPYFEAEMLTNDIAFMVNKMQWKPRVVSDWRESGIDPVIIPNGVQIWSWKQESPSKFNGPRRKAWLAAENLSNVLKLGGIQEVAHLELFNQPHHDLMWGGIRLADNTVFVLVGMKDVDWDLEVIKEQRKQISAKNK